MRLVVNYGLVIAGIVAVFAISVLFPSLANISLATERSVGWLKFVAGIIVLLITVAGGSLLSLTRG